MEIMEALAAVIAAERDFDNAEAAVSVAETVRQMAQEKVRSCETELRAALKIKKQQLKDAANVG